MTSLGECKAKVEWLFRRISTAPPLAYSSAMISCMIADELSDRHIVELAKHRVDDPWEIAMAQKAATDLAWGAVCEHRAACLVCRGKLRRSETVH